MIFGTVLLPTLVALISVSKAHDYGYNAEKHESHPTTKVPSYFNTIHYGPKTYGLLKGEGRQSEKWSYHRKGKASGDLFMRDAAKAAEHAAKTRGYQYKYREGHDYYQPLTLYSYDIEEPIWGYRYKPYVH